MRTEFAPPASLERPANTLAILLGEPSLTADEARDVARIRTLVAHGRALLGMTEGQASFKHDRLNRVHRARAGMELSRRRYDKLFRLIGRLEQYAAELDAQTHLFTLGRFAKLSFAPDLDRAIFGADPATAAFVAYYTANLGRRSLFTDGKQARALDEIAAAMLAQLENRPATNWYAIAHVFPRADVLAHLTGTEQLDLLERTLGILRDTAARLETIVVRDHLSLDTMIVHRGNDSSTWNALAGAWNRARDYWIALVYALGAETLFDAFLPGKVLRLMAADVAYIHRRAGDDLDTDTRVWAALPKPWDVMAGREACARADVERTCLAANIDPARSGWSAPRPRTMVDTWRPTPETVHGVVVDYPELALFLRKAGVFSGQEIHLPVGG